MVVSLGESAIQTSQAMDKIVESISSFTKALSDGLVVIAIVIATSPLNSTSQSNANAQ